MCEDHAREMVMVFNAAKAQQRMQSGYTKRPFIDPDLMNGKSLDLSKMIPEVKDGKWRNVKNIR